MPGSPVISTQNTTFPAFPGGKDVTIAPLATIDLARLIKRDEGEIAKLLSACVTHGFFYLDLQTSEQGRQIVSDEQGVLGFMREYFNQPHEVKMLDDRKSFTHGCVLSLGRPLACLTTSVTASNQWAHSPVLRREQRIAMKPSRPVRSMAYEYEQDTHFDDTIGFPCGDDGEVQQAS